MQELPFKLRHRPHMLALRTLLGAQLDETTTSAASSAYYEPRIFLCTLALQYFRRFIDFSVHLSTLDAVGSDQTLGHSLADDLSSSRVRQPQLFRFCLRPTAHSQSLGNTGRLLCEIASLGAETSLDRSLSLERRQSQTR